MARVSFSALVEEIVGKLAGSVFQDSYGGMQIRTRVSPRNPQTNYQQLRRGEFGYISSLWRTLTSVQRQTFIDAASTPPAALNLFIQANVNLSLINENIIDTYVPSSDPGTMTIEFVDVTPSLMTIKATGSPTVVPAGTKLLIQVTDQKPPTRIFTNPSMYSPVISFDEGTDLATDTDIFAEWTNHYGVLKADKRLCLKANLIDKSNGLRGADVINCTNSELVANKYIPLSRFLATQATTSTSFQALYTYSMPANTLQSPGDRLIITGKFTATGTAGSREVDLRFAGNNFATFDSFPADAYIFHWEILLIDSTHVKIVGFAGNGASIGFNANGTTFTIDPTISNDVGLNAQSNATGDIVATFMSIDLIKAP